MNENNTMKQYNVFNRFTHNKLEQTKLSLRESTELLHQIKQKCTTTTNHYIFKSTDTLSTRHIDNTTFQLLKTKEAPEHQMSYDGSVKVLERYCLDLESMVEYYNNQCQIETLYTTDVDNNNTLITYRNKEYKTLEDVTYLLQLYKRHHTTIQQQFDDNVTWVRESANVLHANTTDLQDYLVTFAENMKDETIKQSVLETTQYDIGKIDHYGKLPEHIYDFEPEEEGTIQEIFENMSYLCIHNDIFLNYIRDMRNKFLFLEPDSTTCVYDVMQVNQDPVQEMDNKNPVNKNIVETRHIQIGNATIKRAISEWTRRLASQYVTSYCTGVGYQEINSSCSSVSEMYECNEQIKYCLDDETMFEDDSKDAMSNAICLYQHADKLHSGLRHICLKLNISSYKEGV